MAELDQLAPNYRRARDRWPTAPTLCSGYEALVASYSGNQHGIIEHVKSYIECVCRTVLEEFKGTVEQQDPTTTQLLVASLKALGVANSRGASKLDSVLSAYNKLADALTEMRNAEGPVAHGRDGFLDSISADHSRAFVFAGDSILGVLLACIDGSEPDLSITREPYESFTHYNRAIDAALLVDAAVEASQDQAVFVLTFQVGSVSDPLELRVEPSRLLYGVDRQAYIEVLRSTAQTELETTPAPEEVMLVPETVSSTSRGEDSPVRVVEYYKGPLATSRAEVELVVHDSGIAESLSLPQRGQLVDSVLATAEHAMATDWAERESLTAGMRVGIRRVLRLFGADDRRAKHAAEEVVAIVRKSTSTASAE